MGKTSLANTLESFLKSPTKSPKSWSWLSENHPELLCTQVMQLYDGLSINNEEEELSVEVGDNTQNVKLVTLKNARTGDKTSVTKEKSDINDEEVLSADGLKDTNKTHVQVKLVDLGGHTAKVLVVFVDFMSVP